MNITNTQVPRFYKESFDALCSEQDLFMRVMLANLPRNLLPRLGLDDSGLLTFDFPLAEALGGTPEETTYVLGTDHVEDSEPHRDLTPKGSLNCHLTLRGTLQARGAVIGDDLHSEGGGLLVPFEEAVPSASIEEIKGTEGEIYMFFGSRVTHEFTSGEGGRLSTMRHYVFEV